MTHGDDEEWRGDNDRWQDWDARITKDVIGAISRRRKEMGMTAQELADETARLGFEVPRNVIANWESGRRKTVTVPELIIVAEALCISPAELVFSPALGGSVTYLPEDDTFRWSAFSRFTGEDPHAPGYYRLASYREHARILNEIVDEHHDAFQLQFVYERGDWPSGSEKKFDRLVAAVRSGLQPIRAAMREMGWVVPPLALHLQFLNAELPPLNSDIDPEDE